MVLVNKMFGWTGIFLNIDLTKSKAVAEKYDEALALNFLGGRGFAVKILWDTLKQGTDPLSPENKLIFATGPLNSHWFTKQRQTCCCLKKPLNWRLRRRKHGNIGVCEYAQGWLRRAYHRGQGDKRQSFSTSKIKTASLWMQKIFGA